MSKITSIKRVVTIFLVVVLMLPIPSMNKIMAKSSTKPTVGKTRIQKAIFTGKGSVKLSWKIAKGAKKYEVYRAANKNGKYTKIKVTSKRKCTDRKVTAGKTYYYKVRAYKMVNKKKVKGAFSMIRSVTLPPKTDKPTPPSGETSVKDFMPGEVVIGLNNSYLGLSLAELFQGLDFIEAEEIKLLGRIVIDKNDTSRTGVSYLVKLTHETKESVLEAIEFLEKNPNVAYAHPNYILSPC